MQFDVVIIGGGTAGCVLASRLSEDPGQAVCLVEAGPDYGPYAGGGWPEDMVDGRQLALSHSWETDREDRSQLRARILGGSAEEHVRAEARGFFHPVAIGSVVDPQGRVLGYENLYVADASIIPEIPSVNTNLTTAAVAERIAEALAE